MKRPSVLFFAKNPHNVVAYERVLRKLIEEDRVALHLTSRNSRVRPPNALFDAFDFPPGLRIDHRLARWRAYDLYLSPDIYLLARRARLKVHTFHGISIKGQAYTRKVQAYDRLFLIGPYQRRRFAQLGVLGEDDERFVEIGMPKTDALFDSGFDRRVWLKERGLHHEIPTVLYAPTWRPEASLESVGDELIRSMQRQPYNLIVKLHDLSLDRAANRVDWRRRLRELKAPNVHVHEEPDITSALRAADLLISDASSVANEFTLLDRPIVFIETPRLFKKYGRTIDLEDWGQKAGPVARDVPGILQAIEAELEAPDRYRAIRRRIAGEGFYNPGRATAAAVGAIDRLLSFNSELE